MKLNQVIAIEKTSKSRIEDAFTQIFKAVQQPALFDGLSRQYKPIDETGERLPSEAKKVQGNAKQSVKDVVTVLSELIDITATKDYANTVAKADIVVDGQVLVKDAPVPFLLFLEKKLTDVRTFLSALPTLDAAEDWEFDPNADLYRTKPTETHRSKKVQKPIVMYPATPEHPAQTQLLTEDQLVGFWETTKFSTALPAPKKAELVARVETLQKAVKVAREAANVAEAQQKVLGQSILGFITAVL